MPWFVRAGKELPEHVTEVLVELKAPPQKVFADSEPEVGPANYMRFRFNPMIEIGLGARAKIPGEAMIGEQRELFLSNEFPDEMSPYERLLGDALAGEGLLFARQDGVEAGVAGGRQDPHPPPRCPPVPQAARGDPRRPTA